MTPSTSKIRIMHIISRMNVGGPAVMISESLRLLDPVKFEQRLYAGACDESEANYIETQAPDILAIKVKGLGRKLNFYEDFTALVILISEIKCFRPNIIHTHTSKAGLLGRVAKIVSRHNCKLIHTYHGHILFGYFGKLKTKVFIRLERILAKKTDVLISVGIKVRDELLNARIGNLEQYTVIYPGVEPPIFFPKDSARDQLGLDFPEGNLVCAFFGRITNIKRPDRFLDVVQECKSRTLAVSFFIAGDGDLSQLINANIKLRALPVQMLGWQSNVGKVLSAADVLIISSDNEGLPLSAIEAGMLSIPVISTNVGSIQEVIINNKTGIITGKSVPEIADALARLASNPYLRKEMGRQSQNLMQKNFSCVQYINKLENLYSDLVLT